MNVTEFISELRQIPDPDNTLVVISASEIDEPCEFVALDEFVREAQTWHEADIMDGLHKAEPAPQFAQDAASVCVHCHREIKRVPGGHGSTWVHADTGAVVGTNEPTGGEQ